MACAHRRSVAESGGLVVAAVGRPRCDRAGTALPRDRAGRALGAARRRDRGAGRDRRLGRLRADGQPHPVQRTDHVEHPLQRLVRIDRQLHVGPASRSPQSPCHPMIAETRHRPGRTASAPWASRRGPRRKPQTVDASPHLPGTLPETLPGTLPGTLRDLARRSGGRDRAKPARAASTPGPQEVGR